MLIKRRTRTRRPAASPLASVWAAILILLCLVLPASAVEGPTKLFAPSVSPTTGTTSTTIVFEVTYRNREGSAPDHVNVVIDGTPHAMAGAGGTDWKAGVRHGWSSKLAVGTHAISFEASDTRKFSNVIINGGTVTITAPPPSPTPTPKPAPTPTPKPAPTPTPKPAPTPTPDPKPASTPPPPNPPNPTTAPASTPTPGSSDGSGGIVGAGVTGGAGGAGGSGGPSPDGGGATTPDPGDITNGVDGWPNAWTGFAYAVTSPDGVRAGGSSGGPGDGTAEGSSSSATSTGQNANGAAGDPGMAGLGWGSLANVLQTLGIERPPAIGMLPMLLGTGAATTMAFAFAIFGRKRRDEQPPAPDEVLHANAAQGHNGLPGSEVVNGVVRGPLVPLPLDGEAAMPRWRRPSLLEARKADPNRSVNTTARLSFDNGAVGSAEGRERRMIRYRVVRLLDAPDELRSADIGQLDQGDEVQLIERSGAYWLVLCPDGRQGWLHKMTLGDVVTDAQPSTPWGQDVDDDVLTAFLQARARA